MNQLQHLLIKLAEEGSEVAQSVLDFITQASVDGIQQCHQELHDLQAIVEMLNDQYAFGYEPQLEASQEDMAASLTGRLVSLAAAGFSVTQISLKTAQFGPTEVMPGQPLNNFERCHQKLDALWATVDQLNRQSAFGYLPDLERIALKKAKVLKYQGYSIHLGLVAGETDVTAHPMAASAA